MRCRASTHTSSVGTQRKKRSNIAITKKCTKIIDDVRASLFDIEGKHVKIFTMEKIFWSDS